MVEYCSVVWCGVVWVWCEDDVRGTACSWCVGDVHMCSDIAPPHRDWSGMGEQMWADAHTFCVTGLGVCVCGVLGGV